MIHFTGAARPLGLLLAFTLLSAGCGGFQSSSKNLETVPLIIPEAAKPVQEMTPTPVAAAMPPPPAPRSVQFTHTVRNNGETLFGIAAWYTGNGNNWARLAEANPALNSKRIPIGAEIVIPGNILITRKPMPKKVLPATVKKKVVQPPIKQPVSADVELFGPIEKTQPSGKVMDSGLSRSLQTLD